MKRMLLVLSVLSLFAYGCNRDSNQASGGGTGMQEEQQGQGTDHNHQGSDMQEEQQNPGVDKSDEMEMRNQNSGTITTPDQQSGTQQ